MTTAAPLLDNEDVLLSGAEDADQVIDQLAEHNRRRERAEAGLCWWLQCRPGDEAPALLVGVRGEVGALQWFEGAQTQAPQQGANGDRVDYFTRWGHHNSVPPHVEVPLETVHAAVRELAATGERPTCVQWTEAQP